MSAATEQYVLARPEGMPDGRWQAVCASAHLVVTGHAPWCELHTDDTDGTGWCRRVLPSFAAEAEISNGTTDGSTQIGIYLADGVDLEALTTAQAAAISAVLEHATLLAVQGNLTFGAPE